MLGYCYHIKRWNWSCLISSHVGSATENLNNLVFNLLPILTDQPLHRWDSSLAALGFRSVLSSCFSALWRVTLFLSLLQIISLFDLVRYCVSVCNQIACHLHIFVFKIKPCSVLSSAPHWGHAGHYWLCPPPVSCTHLSLPSVLHVDGFGGSKLCFCQLNVRTNNIY